MTGWGLPNDVASLGSHVPPRQVLEGMGSDAQALTVVLDRWAARVEVDDVVEVLDGFILHRRYALFAMAPLPGWRHR